MGQQRLREAITTFQARQQPTSPNVSVTWKPFIIDPGTKKDGEDMEAYCRRRWGGSGWTQHTRDEGAKSGAHFGDWKWWPNTVKAHQLVLFGEERGVCTDEMNSALFRALYEEGKNISLVSTLVDIGARKFNLPAEELRQYLETDSGADNVKRLIMAGRRKYNIKGVPFFIIGKGDGSSTPYGLSGAQSTKAFLRVFDSLMEDEDD